MITDHKRKWLDSWEEQRNAKLHFKRKWRINCTSRCKKKRYQNSLNKNLDELRNELTREEPPWRTPVTKGWWDRNERWKNKIKACDDLDGGSDEMAVEIWTPGQENMKTLGTRIYSWRTNSEGKDYLLGWNKNKIYCMLILHQIKLMTRWIFFMNHR